MTTSPRARTRPAAEPSTVCAATAVIYAAASGDSAMAHRGKSKKAAIPAPARRRTLRGVEAQDRIRDAVHIGLGKLVIERQAHETVGVVIAPRQFPAVVARLVERTLMQAEVMEH